MSKDRISIYPGPEMARVIGERKRDESTLTQTINAIVDRYGEICARNRPQLTEGEWMAVCDCCNGTWFAPASTLVGSVLTNVEDTPELADKWDIDQPALQRKLAALSYCEQVALVDMIERFWAAGSIDNATEQLRNIGAIK